jgi:hypothetical protein
METGAPDDFLGVWIIVDDNRQRFIQTFIETHPHNNPPQFSSASSGNQVS